MAQDERSQVRSQSLVAPTLLSLVMVVAGLQVPFAIGDFDSLFRAFGADPPWLTRTVISYRFVICSIFVLGLLAQFVLLIALMNQRTDHARRLFYRVAGVNFLFLLVLIVAMYLPIFQLGSVV